MTTFQSHDQTPPNIEASNSKTDTKSLTNPCDPEALVSDCPVNGKSSDCLDQSNLDPNLLSESLESTLKQLDHNHQFYISPRTRISLGDDSTQLWANSTLNSSDSSIKVSIPKDDSNNLSLVDNSSMISDPVSSQHPSISAQNSLEPVRNGNLRLKKSHFKRSQRPRSALKYTDSNISDDEDLASVCDDNDLKLLRDLEAEDEEDSDDNGIINENGYCDGREIDERTEKAILSPLTRSTMISQPVKLPPLYLEDNEDITYGSNGVFEKDLESFKHEEMNRNFGNNIESKDANNIPSGLGPSLLNDQYYQENTNLFHSSSHPSHKYAFQQQDYFQEPPNLLAGRTDEKDDYEYGYDVKDDEANRLDDQDEQIEYKPPALPPHSENSIHIRVLAKDMLPAPENFSMVVNGIYRSSFPRADSFEFLKKIKLKSILVLIPEQYPEENLEFMKSENISFFQVGMPGNKEPFVHVPHTTITQALSIAIDPKNHPILIHCNRGKHRTGCVVGCIRRLQNWSLTMIFDEYRRFAFPKARPLDQQLIELYNDDEMYEKATREGWLPLDW